MEEKHYDLPDNLVLEETEVHPDALGYIPVSYNDLRGENAGATWPTYTDYRVDATSFFGVFRARFGNQFIFDLPTDAQWEMACRDKGTSDRTTDGFWGSSRWNNGVVFDSNFSGAGDVAWYKGNANGASHEVGLKGANLYNLANYDGDSSVVPHEVGTKKPNKIGLYDMHGNVDEVCLDIWTPDIRNYTVDPVGPDHAWNLFRVIRGGDCSKDAKDCRAACRSEISPGNRLSEDGFRAVFNPFVK